MTHGNTVIPSALDTAGGGLPQVNDFVEHPVQAELVPREGSHVLGVRALRKKGSDNGGDIVVFDCKQAGIA